MPIDEKITVGLIGLGSFGSKIQRVLKGDSSVDLVFEGTYNFTSAPKCDWIIIATPVFAHKAICHWFLDRNTNVLVAKPCSTSSSDLVELIDHAKSSRLSLYVDDVFRYSTMFNKIFEFSAGNLSTSDLITVNAKWQKNGPFRDSLGNALAYHHFYMLSALNLGGDIGELEIHLNRLNKKSFTAQSGRFLFNSELDRCSKGVLHQIEINGSVFETLPSDKDVALEKMISSVINGHSDLDLNHRIAISAQKATDSLNLSKPQCAVVGGGIFGSVIATR